MDFASATIHVGEPDIPAGLTISEYRRSRPPRTPWWRELRRNAAHALAATCTLLLAGLALSTAARADTPCPDGARCGKLTVPLDRANPSAGTTDIHYALIPRRDTSRPALGTILPNPGGPGSGAIIEADAWRELLAPLRERRDILLIDPRGAGRSDPLACPALQAQNPLTLDLAAITNVCGADLGARAGLYGSAAMADDFDAVRAALGIEKVDLWGQSWGTFFLPVYAARHPERVRSIVLTGAQPLDLDTWGRDLLRGVKRTIGLVCRRTDACSGPRVVDRLDRLARRLHRHPVPFTVPSPQGPVRLTLGERELAEVVYGRGNPWVYGLLPAAVGAALDRDYALLKRLAATFRIIELVIPTMDPSESSWGQLAATTCHDYPHPFDLADPPAVRQGDYDRALAAIGRDAFRPFSSGAWFQSGIWAGPACLHWPVDPTAGSPLEGRPMPDVPVLVQSGDLDTNTPIEQGRATAAQFKRATFAVIANAGHTPDVSEPCAAAMAIDFIRRLRTEPDRCKRAGEPPAVVGRPARRAADLPPIEAKAPARLRRAIAVALSTVADAQAAAQIAPAPIPVRALRGGTYVPTEQGIRFRAARVVSGAVASGAQRNAGRGTVARLRLRGRAVPRARLTLRFVGTTTRISGTVGGRRVEATVRTQRRGH